MIAKKQHCPNSWRNHSSELDLLNESFDPVHKTGQNDSFISWTFSFCFIFTIPCITALTEPLSPKVSIPNCSFFLLFSAGHFWILLPLSSWSEEGHEQQVCMWYETNIYNLSISQRYPSSLLGLLFPSVWIIKIRPDDQTVSSWGYKVLLSWGWTVTSVVVVVVVAAVAFFLQIFLAAHRGP